MTGPTKSPGSHRGEEGGRSCGQRAVSGTEAGADALPPTEAEAGPSPRLLPARPRAQPQRDERKGQRHRGRFRPPRFGYSGGNEQRAQHTQDRAVRKVENTGFSNPDPPPWRSASPSLPTAACPHPPPPPASSEMNRPQSARARKEEGRDPASAGFRLKCKVWGLALSSSHALFLKLKWRFLKWNLHVVKFPLFRLQFHEF